jgi:hypothetical protein
MLACNCWTDGRYRLLFARLRDARGCWETLLDWLIGGCPHLANRLRGARPMLSVRWQSPACLMALDTRPPRMSAGLFRLGDQATVIASLTGDGVALALTSAALATRTWMREGNQAAHYHHMLARALAQPMRVASLLHGFANTSSVQPWLLRACRAWPGAMRLAASWTRAPRTLRIALSV